MNKSSFVIVIVSFILISITIVSYSEHINSIRLQDNLKNTENINLLFSNKNFKKTDNKVHFEAYYPTINSKR